ncbi:MAG: hypothetical protein ACKOCH_16475, partial [Bacteroidota bacterium]
MQNKGITLTLYGVLFIILFSSVYLYCQKRKEQIDLEQDRIEVDNEINKTYRTDIGAGASTEGGSSFSENSADAEKPEAAVKETRPASPATQPAEKPAAAVEADGTGLSAAAGFSAGFGCLDSFTAAAGFSISLLPSEKEDPPSALVSIFMPLRYILSA